MKRILIGAALAGALTAVSISSVNAQYYGQGLPSGSYQSSCANIRMNGSTLSASCTNGAGQRVYSSLNVNRCNGASVRNNNGYLICSNGYGNNGYNNGNQYGHHNHNGYNNNGHYNGSGYNGSLPPGSYQGSCTNIRMNGSTLSASCTAANGQRVYSSINVNRCVSRGTPVRNENGQLRC